MTGFEEDPSCLHPSMHPIPADMNEARPLDWHLFGAHIASLTGSALPPRPSSTASATPKQMR